MKIAVVIPSKNGLHHMKECLPTVLAAAKKSTVPVSITVVVGDSTDGSMQEAPALFPQVKFLENPKHGASSARNFGVAATQGEWLCFLDNDVFVDEDFFNTAQKYLRPDVFCVACAGYCAYPKKAGAWEQLDGVKLLGWKKGFPRFTHNIYNDDLPEMQEYPSWGVQGAYFFCQRSYFDLLGGFDENLDPYMLEETDLVYRGLKRGWKVIYAPDTKPRHKCGGTINSKKSKFTQFLSKRNRTWFVWKNIHDSSLCLAHWLRFVFSFSPRLWKECLKDYSVFHKAALREKSARKKTDLELLEESKAFEHKCKVREVELRQQKLNIKLGVDYLQARLNRYTHKYNSVTKIATHMMWACFLAAISKKQKNNHISGPVRICLTIEGGMGDMLMSLNWATAFYNKFCKEKGVKCFVCCHNISLLPHLTATLSDFLSESERDSQYFDLKITCNRSPIVQYANLQRLPVGLLAYVEKLLDLERENKYFLTVPYKDCITYNIVSNIQKRWAQPDLVNEFNLQEEWVLDVPLEREKETLQKFGLTDKKYITINREVGDTQLVDSTKLWPVEYYRKLVADLKEIAPQYQIIEVGCGKGERIGNADNNLAGKTSLEEIKVILKHSLLHIDSEGGLVHLRHALKGGSSCVFFGPSSPKVLGYSENLNLCSRACPIHCEFYSRTWQETCIKQNHICMNTILEKDALKQIKIKLGL
ncbi:glycosyltransferase [Candidatus Avelusimicrobium stercoris]|uniref:glycosyltransferase n=1 Tax=Candidatus Avelusimicrobium stercoris TaxID=1947924 RepID=UPI003D11C129